MPREKPPVNPFYLSLLIVGVAFFITACAYGVMAFRAMKITDPTSGPSGQGLMALMRDYGAAMLTVELILLAITTIGAIWLDDVRQKRQAVGRNDQRIDPPSP